MNEVMLEDMGRLALEGLDDLARQSLLELNEEAVVVAAPPPLAPPLTLPELMLGAVVR